MLEALREVLVDALDPSDPVAVLNGAFPEINMKELLPGRVVVRSRSDQAAPMSERIATLYARTPLTPENTRILSAIPASADDLPRIDRSSADWDLWGGTTQTYATTVADRGFSLAMAVQATAPEFLDALKTKENVIVLVAHARSDCLYFPDGSRVRPSDIEAIRDDIARNKPVVYLFYCKTAQYANGRGYIRDTAALRCGGRRSSSGGYPHRPSAGVVLRFSGARRSADADNRSARGRSRDPQQVHGDLAWIESLTILHYGRRCRHLAKAKTGYASLSYFWACCSARWPRSSMIG